MSRDELQRAIASDVAFLVQKIGRFQGAVLTGEDAAKKHAYVMLESAIDQLADTIVKAVMPEQTS